MIFILNILCVLVGLVLSRSKKPKVQDAGFVMAFVGTVLLVFLMPLWLFTKKEVGRTDYTRPIYSLRVQKEFSGGFFLGSGGAGDSLKYYYYTKDERGAFVLDSEYAIGCRLLETDEMPREFYQQIHYGGNPWVFPFDIYEDGWSRSDLYVPANTVIRDFKTE